jgi:hypothetical protein
MTFISKINFLLVLIIVLMSCNTFVPGPTETPIPAATSLPTLTSTSEPTITLASKPTETPVPATDTLSPPVFPLPLGTPVANWQGIPVMPSAISGDGDEQGYSYSVEASLDEVQKFYEKEMALLGWNLLASGQGTTGAILIIFTKEQDTASVSVIPQLGGLVYVTLVK